MELDFLHDGIVILDGAMGTVLQQRGLPPGGKPELLNFTNPDLLRSIYREYIEAGSQILCANTFGASAPKLAGTGYTVEEVVSAAIGIAKEAAAGTDVKISLDMGPLGELLEPLGTLPFERAYEYFKEAAVAGERAGADLVAIETMTDLYEAKAALLAVKENTSLPVLVTMSFEQNGRTFTGCAIPSMARTLEGLGADAVGLNCSLGPDLLLPLVKELRANTRLPVIVKPNAGLPDPATGAYGMGPEEFAAAMLPIVEAGADLVGGCCGTSPDYIGALVKALEGRAPALGSGMMAELGSGLPAAFGPSLGRSPNDRSGSLPAAFGPSLGRSPNDRSGSLPAAFGPSLGRSPNDRSGSLRPLICSATTPCFLDGVRVIGERVNPTGKKRFQQALLENDLDYILDVAVQQEDAGADILDVNVGFPGVDEASMLPRVVKKIQSAVSLPLQLDSSDPAALEAGLRVYNGKAAVNSVNGERSVLDRVLPIVKKYGASVVGLCLDENGIPPTAEGRVAIARRILDAALGYGIPREDVWIDCLTLTVSAQQEQATETLKAVGMVREELGLQVVLGVSNISFGLPNRPLVTQSFLTQALAAGLTLPIINPNQREMMDAVAAFKVLSGEDGGCRDYIARFAGAAPAPSAPVGGGSSLNLEETVIRGLEGDAGRLAKEALQTQDELSLVEQRLIPALDRVGADYEAGRAFLPQLLSAAQAAQAVFEVIKASVAEKGGTPVKKGRFAIATVKGDIHDIGKNIVRTVMENYGYEAVDLGRDVPPEAVVDAVREQNIRLVGLSALMTTTLPAMEETIRQLKALPDPPAVWVGGAVVTAEHAARMGADYYAKDARQSVEIARKVFGA